MAALFETDEVFKALSIMDYISGLTKRTARSNVRCAYPQTHPALTATDYVFRKHSIELGLSVDDIVVLNFFETYAFSCWQE